MNRLLYKGKRVGVVTIVRASAQPTQWSWYRAHAHVYQANPQHEFEAYDGIRSNRYRFRDEGISWARGWHTKEAEALCASVALR